MFGQYMLKTENNEANTEELEGDRMQDGGRPSSV